MVMENLCMQMVINIKEILKKDLDMVKVVTFIKMVILIMVYGLRISNLEKVLIITITQNLVIMVFGIIILDMVKENMNIVMVIDLKGNFIKVIDMVKVNINIVTKRWLEVIGIITKLLLLIWIIILLNKIR